MLQAERGDGEAVLFARSATAGCQKFPVHWGGDCNASYDSMAESLRGGLSLCASGFGFWSHDISGFEHTASPALYKRWVAFGLLSSHSRLHGNHSYRVPWNFDEEACDVLRYFTRWKCQLMPYLYRPPAPPPRRALRCDARYGTRPLPDDPACADPIDNICSPCPSLLVVPVFADHGPVEDYLPSGLLQRLFLGEVREGGRRSGTKRSILHLPLWLAKVRVPGARSRATGITPTPRGSPCAAIAGGRLPHRRARFPRPARRGSRPFPHHPSGEQVTGNAKPEMRPGRSIMGHHGLDRRIRREVETHEAGVCILAEAETDMVTVQGMVVARRA